MRLFVELACAERLLPVGTLIDDSKPFYDRGNGRSFVCIGPHGKASRSTYETVVVFVLGLSLVTVICSFHALFR